MMADFESEDHDVSFLVNASDSPMTVKWNYSDGYEGSASVYYPGNGNIVKVDMSEGAATLVIPAYEGVLIVREDDNRNDDVLTDETTEEITDEITEDTTEEVADETTEAVDDTTEAPVDETTANQIEEPKKGGCGSTVGGSVAVVIGAVGGMALSRRKKRK